MGTGTGRGVGIGSQSQIEERRDSRTGGGFLDNMFGAGAVANISGDAGGLSRWGDLNVHGEKHNYTGSAADALAARDNPQGGGQGSGQGSGQGAGQGGGAGSSSGHLHHDATVNSPRHGGLGDTESTDFDELATRLYERLRSRLRRELLVDRERAGLLTDFR
jgi:hypothetical protein